MHRRTPTYRAYWVPDDIDPDEAVLLGLTWLLQQPGEPLILLNRKASIRNNRDLEAAVRYYGIPYQAPNTVLRSPRSRWNGGAILAPWASDEVIRCIDDRLAFKADAVCLIGWDHGSHDSWITARSAVDLRDGSPLGEPLYQIISDPVVRIALDHAESWINHNNGLVQAEDKSYVILTLQELVRGGHPLSVDEICTYTMATGWSGEEVRRIREYTEHVRAGHSFRLQVNVGPKPGSCKHWEQEARAQNGSP